MNKYNVNVLIIEDNETLADVMVRVLKQFFTKKIEVLSLKDLSLNNVEFSKYDFLICNVNKRRNFNVLDTLASIKASNKNLKTVITTETPSEQLEEKIFEIGVDKYLPKPYRLKDILTPLSKDNVAC